MKSLLNDVKLYLGVVKRTFYTLSLGMFSPDRRDDLLALYNATQPKTSGTDYTPVDPYILPKTDIFLLLNNDSAVYEGVYECGFGHTTEFELKVISNLVRQANPKRIFEIGTFQGRTTLNMALNTDENCEIITLDLPASDLETTKMDIEEGEIRYVKKERSGERFLNHEARHKIKQVYGDSASYPFEKYANSVDLAFIDGSHAFEYVLNDSKKILSIMRPGSLILWHDYTNWEGVRDALNDLYKTDARFRNLKHIGGTSIVIMSV